MEKVDSSQSNAAGAQPDRRCYFLADGGDGGLGLWFGLRPGDPNACLLARQADVDPALWLLVVGICLPTPAVVNLVARWLFYYKAEVLGDQPFLRRIWHSEPDVQAHWQAHARALLRFLAPGPDPTTRSAAGQAGEVADE